MIFNYFVVKNMYAIEENKVNELIDGHSFIEKNFGRFKCYS